MMGAYGPSCLPEWVPAPEVWVHDPPPRGVPLSTVPPLARPRPWRHRCQEGIIQLRTATLISLMALTRKFIVLDANETEPPTVIGLANAVLALGAVDWLVLRHTTAHSPWFSRPAGRTTRSSDRLIQVNARKPPKRSALPGRPGAVRTGAV